MDLERNAARSIRSAPIAQVALAALVAGSLLAFSALAFRTAFNDDAAPGSLAANAPRVTAAAPVLLPASRSAITPTPPPAQVATDETAVDMIAATEIDPRGDVVLGTRVARTKAAARAAEVTEERRAPHPAARPSAGRADTHKNQNGKGHEKAQGKGHLKSKDSKSSRDVEAREEDDEWDDNGDDDDGRDDDDGSGSSRSGGNNSGKGGSNGSGGSRSGSGRG